MAVEARPGPGTATPGLSRVPDMAIDPELVAPGHTAIVLNEIQPNVPIDAAKFAKPAPAVTKRQGK